MNSGEHTSHPRKEHWLKAFHQSSGGRAVIVALFLLGGLLLLPATPGQVQTSDAGYALLFDGNNDYVELHETSAMLGSGWEETKTVSLWVKPTGTVSCYLVNPSKCNIIFGDRPRWWGISIGERLGQDKIWVWNNDGGFDLVGVDYSLDNWVHVTLVHSDGVLRAYRNGIEVGSTPSGSTQQPPDGEPILNLGGVIVHSQENWTFAGELDEVRLWDNARSPTQVQGDMYHSLEGDETGLMAYYKMSDGSGLTLTDDTGNGWDGALMDGRQDVPPDGSPPEWVDSNAFEIQPTPTLTATPTGTGTPTPTNTSTPTVTFTPSPGPSGTPTPTPDPNSTSTPTPLPTLDVGDLDFRFYVPVLERGG